MRWSWRSEAVPLLLIAIMSGASAWAWGRVPEPMPVHWSLAGEVDGWGSRSTGLVLLPLVALGIYALFFVAPLLDPGRANYPRFRGVFLVLRATILGVLVVLHMALIASAVQPSLHPGRAMAPVMGSLFVVIGLTLGKVRPNWFVGIRTPWTLSSKRSWTRSHRLGGWLFLCTGLATLLAWLVVPGIALIVLIAAGAATALSVAVYSYVVWRDDPERIPPAGTSPSEDG
jgi:uncharacterized membrane protein